ERQFRNLFGESKETNSGISIRTILNSFVTKMIGCDKYHQDFFQSRCEKCDNCDLKCNCFKFKLLDAYETDELKNDKVETREGWLNARTNFIERFEKKEQDFMGYFINTFLGIISEFEKHNLNKIENALENEENKENFEMHLEEIKNYMQGLFKDECEIEDEILLYMNKRYKDLK
ncbi:MAG: hypothetical protein K2G55_01965, partial [Lachnospiraceae bacterium]|nr:hypothetical protein [Lachnospiraceae bacterium]